MLKYNISREKGENMGTDFVTINEPTITIKRVIDERTFFNRVYATMGVGLALTFIISFLLYKSNILLNLVQSGAGSGIIWVAIFAQLGLVLFITSKMQLSTADQPMKAGLSSTTAYILFFVYSIITAITLSVIFYGYSDHAILVTLVTTVVMFVGLSIIGRTTKKDLSVLGKFLIVALIGLILTMILNLFLGSSAIDYVLSIAGVLIFSGLIVYDNNALKAMYNNGFINESNLIVFGALSLYLDFINLFIRLLSLTGNRN